MSGIERFGHGGDVLTASALYGVDPDCLLDFSANINPLGPPPEALEAIKDEMRRIVHYPDPAHRRLIGALAEKYITAEETILIGNGAAECMALLLLALAPRKVGVTYPSFVEYGQLARQYGAEVIGCTGAAENGFLPSVAELEILLDEVDVLFVGHPNNPTGLSYDLESVRRLAVRAAEKKAYLVMDEAFIDFLPPDRQPTLLPDIVHYPHVILLRSMTKFYAIPGLRLGFTVAHPDLIARMKEKQIPWSVNRLALAAGEACCRIDAYEARTRGLIAAERQYLYARLSGDLQLVVWPGQANFLLARLPESWTAAALQQVLGKKGIMIRNCSMYPGLTPQDFRVAVRSREENDRLLAALAEALAEEREKR
ncbi:threonine-phosphate decarboxylase [Aneurinibacillus sp. BA2021]|nr:threonine-phosphate decarboxylase [Aneurinibacillus sp. BA2021]